MKSITEEQRQELIEFILAAQESMGGNEPVNPNKFDIEKMTPGVFEIALASLTAEPVGFLVGEGKHIYYPETARQAAAQGILVSPLYTAPPVTVIKFPNPQDIPDGYDLPSCMATAEWYQQEIKRLNGLEQS